VVSLWKYCNYSHSDFNTNCILQGNYQIKILLSFPCCSLGIGEKILYGGIFTNQQEPKIVKLIILFIFLAITIVLGSIRAINEIL